MRVRPYERQAGIAPLPQSQAIATPPAGDFGLAAGRIIENVADRLHKIESDTQDARTLELFNQFKQDSANYHDDPDKGIYNTRLGFQARGMYQDADQWMRSKGEEYVRLLDSARAKDNFRKMALDHITQQGVANSRFEAAQTRQYRIETAKAAIENNLRDIESNWDNPEVIEQARGNIQQALELQMRGSGQEEFNDAYAKIENQIGLARIRQAYVKDPLLAVSMLDDPDIHLTPDTKAQLEEKLKNKTEVYELQAIAEAYSQDFSPENSVSAYETLIKRYGADKGQKAFAALSRIWSIQNSQDTAKKQRLTEIHNKNKEAIIKSVVDPNTKQFTREQVTAMMNSGAIEATTAKQYIEYLDKKEKADKSEQDNAMKNALYNLVDAGEVLSEDVYSSITETLGYEFSRTLRNRQNSKANEAKKAVDDERKNNEDVFTTRFFDPDKPDPTRDELTKARNEGKISANKYQSYMDLITSREDKQARLQEQEEKKKKQQDDERLKTNAANLLKRAILNENLTEDEIKSELAQNNITPQAGETLSNYVRSENNRKAKGVKDTADEQRNNKGLALVAEAERGNFPLSRNEMISLLESQQISQTDFDKVEAARKAVNKKQAEDAKAQRKDEIYNLAENYSRQYYVGHEEEFYDFIRTTDKFSPEEKKELTTQYDKFISQQKTALKNSKDVFEQIHSKAFSILKTDYENGKYLPDEIFETKYVSGQLSNSEYNELKNIKQANEKEDERKKTAQIKVEQQKWEDDMYDTAGKLFEKYGDNIEAAMSDIRSDYSRKDAEKIRQYYNERLTDLRAQEQRNAKALNEQQGKNYYDTLDQYIRQGIRVPESLLRQYERDEALSSEGITKIRAMNAALLTRDGIIKYLSEDTSIDFPSMSRPEQEKLIMQRMGTNEEQRKKNVAELFQLYIDGKLTDDRIDYDYIHGKIHPDDRENLKEYDKKFERQQKQIIQQTAKDLQLQLRALKIPGEADRALLVDLAVNDFYNATRWIDPHAKNFNEAVIDAYNSAVAGLIERTQGKITDGWFFSSETLYGKRIRELLQYTEQMQLPQPEQTIPYENSQGQWGEISPQGNIQDFDNSVPIQQNQAQTQQENTTLKDYTEDFVKQYPQYRGLVQQDKKYSLPSPQDIRNGINSALYHLGAPIRHYFNEARPEAITGTHDITKSILVNTNPRITSGYSAERTELRNGRSHLAVDLGMPEGSNVYVPDHITNWQVSKTGNNDTAGNFMTLQATLSNGDVHEITFAHLSSIQAQKGDYVSTGDIVAKSGNSGNSTGPHLHVSYKVNGKSVNPTEVTIEGAQQVSQPQALTQPQTLSQPVVSSDADILNLLFGGLSLDKDILTIDFGVNY